MAAMVSSWVDTVGHGGGWEESDHQPPPTAWPCQDPAHRRVLQTLLGTSPVHSPQDHPAHLQIRGPLTHLSCASGQCPACQCPSGARGRAGSRAGCQG